MKQAFLASGLIAAAVALFVVGRMMLPGAAPEVAVLGDLSAMQVIVSDVTAIAKTGDMAAAKARIADLETAWDDAEAAMRPNNPDAWGRVDEATDAALSALRAKVPDVATVDATLVTLSETMADPGVGDAAPGGVVMIGDVPVTDGNGHPLPCEAMLAEVKAAASAKPPAGEAAAKVSDLVAKATERCNADDDQHSDAFSAAALQTLMTN
jgi:hypothetical protein